MPGFAVYICDYAERPGKLFFQMTVFDPRFCLKTHFGGCFCFSPAQWSLCAYRLAQHTLISYLTMFLTIGAKSSRCKVIECPTILSIVIVAEITLHTAHSTGAYVQTHVGGVLFFCLIWTNTF